MDRGGGSEEAVGAAGDARAGAGGAELGGSHLAPGNVVFAGVDYEAIVARAEREADLGERNYTSASRTETTRLRPGSSMVLRLWVMTTNWVWEVSSRSTRRKWRLGHQLHPELEETLAGGGAAQPAEEGANEHGKHRAAEGGVEGEQPSVSPRRQGDCPSGWAVASEPPGGERGLRLAQERVHFQGLEPVPHARGPSAV